MLSNGIGISQHRLNSASCVDFICFGSKFRQNYRLWHLAHRKTRKKQGPSTCRAPAKKTLVIGSCMLPFLAIWFLYVGLTRSWFRLLGSCNILSTMGSLVRTCFNFVSRIDSHMVQVEVWSIAKRCRPLVIGFGIPPANHLGGTLLPKRMFLFYDREGYPPEKICWRFVQGECPRPRGHSRSYGFQFGH